MRHTSDHSEKVSFELPCQRADASTHHGRFLQGCRSCERKMWEKSDGWLPIVGQNFL